MLAQQRCLGILACVLNRSTRLLEERRGGCADLRMPSVGELALRPIFGGAGMAWAAAGVVLDFIPDTRSWAILPGL